MSTLEQEVVPETGFNQLQVGIQLLNWFQHGCVELIQAQEMFQNIMGLGVNVYPRTYGLLSAATIIISHSSIIMSTESRGPHLIPGLGIDT